MVYSCLRCAQLCKVALAAVPRSRLHARRVASQVETSPIVAEKFGLDHDHMLTIVDVYWQARSSILIMLLGTLECRTASHDLCDLPLRAEPTACSSAGKRHI